jgi:hypothetical protein
MESFFSLLVPVALAAVAIVLILGLWNMLKGGSPSRSQNLMRARIVFQAIAIVVIMTAIYFAS